MSKVVNMVWAIWANEAGISVYVFDEDRDRRRIEIHGVVNDCETVLASATIEKHNRNTLADSIAPVETETCRWTPRTAKNESTWKTGCGSSVPDVFGEAGARHCFACGKPIEVIEVESNDE